MLRFIILLLPVFIYASTIEDIIKGIDSGLLVKSKKEQTKALEKILNSKKSKNYPSFDFNFKAIRLSDTPTSVFNIPSFPQMELPVGTKDNLSASLLITYPLFTGYAITNSIKKARLKVLKNRLETKDLQRNLYLKAISIYSNIYALNEAIKATDKAIDAIEKSYKKAKGLYENGMLNPADLYNIEAKKYDLKTTSEEYQRAKKELLNNLFYLTDLKEDIYKLPILSLHVKENEILEYALKNREDLNALKTELKIDEKDIALSKSKYYPNITVFGAVKREGDDLSLNGNGHTNADKSYIGASFKWNIFDGYEKQNTYQAAVIKRKSRVLYIRDYKKAITKEIKNSFLTLKSLGFKKISAQKEIKASKSYFKLIKGRFENSLSSADELSRAIADLAKARAKLHGIEAKIFLQKCRILLLAGGKKFKEYAQHL